jgi:hypothetical protein
MPSYPEYPRVMHAYPYPTNTRLVRTAEEEAAAVAAGYSRLPQLTPPVSLDPPVLPEAEPAPEPDPPIEPLLRRPRGRSRRGAWTEQT